MSANRLLGSVAVAAFLTTAGAALAQNAVQERLEGGSNLAAFHGDSMSLSNAINAIQQQTGGKVLEIRFEDWGGRGIYSAVVETNGGLTRARVDAQTDKAVTSDRPMPQWMNSWEARADVRSLNKATVPLAQAIKTAEQAANGGAAIDAGLAKPLTAANDVLAYNIEVVRAGHPMRVAVDAKTDQVIADPNMLDTWTPE
jgi:uncharacterized membrane protein YkoI